MTKAYEHTAIKIEETKAHIGAIIAKYGGKLVSIVEVPGRVIVMMDSNHVPPRKLRFVLHPPVGITRAIERECMTKWRSLYYYIKAALVAVDVGIMVFEQAFMAWIVNPSTNQTLYEEIRETHLIPPPQEPPSNNPQLH